MSRTRAALLIPALLVLLIAPLTAQEPEAPAMDPEMAAMMEAWQKAMTPGEPHDELAKRAGSFKMTISSWMAPAAPPMKSEGTVERAMILGGRVLEEKVASDMMGTPFTGIARTGYDNVSGDYWSTWIDTMSTGVFYSKGGVDDSGVIVMHGEYADPMTGGMTQVRSVAHPEKDGKEVFEWYEDRGEGEVKTMEIVYERVGS